MEFTITVILIMMMVYIFAGFLFTAVFSSKVDITGIFLWPILLIGLVAFLLHQYDEVKKSQENKEDDSWIE